MIKYSFILQYIKRRASMSSIDKLNELNSRNDNAEHRDEYDEAINAIAVLLGRIRRVNEQVSYMCSYDLIKFTCHNETEFHLEIGKLELHETGVYVKLWYIDKDGFSGILDARTGTYRLKEQVESGAENLIDKMINVNSDKNEIVSKVLCKGSSIDSADFYYYNFVNAIADTVDYTFMKEYSNVYISEFTGYDWDKFVDKKTSGDRVKPVVIIDMLNKVSMVSSIVHMNKTVGESNILFEAENGNNSISISLDDYKVLVITVKNKDGITIGATTLSSYVEHKFLGEVYDDLMRICEHNRLDSSLYSMLLSLDKEYASIKLDDYPEHLKDIFKKMLEDIDSLFVS